MPANLDPQLLATLASNPAAAQQLLAATLAERAGDDPRVATVLQLLSAQAQPPMEHHDDDPDAHRRARVARIKRTLRALRDERDELRAQVEDLAAALGACARCWGETRRCETCGGDGSPGWLEPEGRLFDALIAPAVARRSGQNHE